MRKFLVDFLYLAAKITPNFITFVTIDKIFAAKMRCKTFKKNEFQQ